MEIVVAPPKFFSIQSVQFTGYNLSQQGTQLVLRAVNKDDPFQLWYKDESLKFLKSKDGQLPLVFINHGSRMALRSQQPNATQASMHTYKPSDENHSFYWTEECDHGGTVTISSFRNPSAKLGLGSHDETANGAVAIVVSSFTTWKFIPYDPVAYKLECNWVSQVLTYKVPRTDITFIQGPSSGINDELNVVGISPRNDTGDAMIWYRVPAGGQQKTTFYSSFIIINKQTGLALKGSTRAGDKVVATEYDPLDSDFVWSEDREKASSTRETVCISPSTLGATHHSWTLPADTEYQNFPWYHPLILEASTSTPVTRQSWKFIPV